MSYDIGMPSHCARQWREHDQRPSAMDLLRAACELHYACNCAEVDKYSWQEGKPQTMVYDAVDHVIKLLMVDVYGASNMEAARAWLLDCGELPTPEQLEERQREDKLAEISDEFEYGRVY